MASFETSRFYQVNDIPNLLKEVRKTHLTQRHIISVGSSGIYILWISPFSGEAQLSVGEAADWTAEFLTRSSRTSDSFICTYRDEHQYVASMKPQIITGMLALMKITDTVLHTNCFTVDEEDRIRAHPGFSNLQSSSRFNFPSFADFADFWPGRKSYRLIGSTERKRSLWESASRFILLLAGTTTLLLLLLFIFVHIHQRSSFRSDIWVRYDTHGSTGPRYQLQFNRHNVTKWQTEEQRSHFTSNKEWAFRIDDQAMVPAHLYTPEEDKYQQWFQHRYPEKNEVREKKLYLNQTFLSDPYAIQVDSDEAFHTAHCVLALRRYWWAKESGTHVCPRDIDYRHMKHCLDSLDELAFPGGLRGPVEHPPEPDDTVLIWKTKVCF